MTLSEFIKKYDGKFVEYHSYNPAAKNQCVDSVNQYIVEVLGFPAIIGTDAVDFPKKAGSNYEWIANGDTNFPLTGDLIIWKENHIAICVKADVNRITSFDQNYPTKTPCHLQDHTYKRPIQVIGWLRPKKEIMNDALTECLVAHKNLVDQTVNLKKQIEALKSEAEAFKVDTDNMRKGYEEDIAKLKVELEGKLLLETQIQQERDGRREDQLKFDMRRLEWEGEMEKIKQQMASEDLSLRDYKVLIKALMKKILRDIESLKK